jgi:hypothetical protein
MILRSAFWLTVGFLVVAPHGTDFGAIASQTRDQVMTAGAQTAQQLVVSQTLTKTVAAVVIDKLASSSSTPSAVHPMQVSPAVPFVFPRSRPVAMG